MGCCDFNVSKPIFNIYADVNIRTNGRNDTSQSDVAVIFFLFFATVTAAFASCVHEQRGMMVFLQFVGLWKAYALLETLSLVEGVRQSLQSGALGVVPPCSVRTRPN